jgi:hypothetical protein
MQRAVVLLDAMGARGLDRVPVAWRVPAAACADADSAADAFRTSLARRVDDRGDRIVPMGLTGAPHVVLRVEEIGADVDWSVSNIWNTGVRDALRREPCLIAPNGPETLRHDALASYGRAPVPVGLIGRGDDGSWITIVANDDGSAARALPLLPGDSLGTGEVTRRSLVRALRRRRVHARDLLAPDTPVVLHLTIVTAEAASQAADVLEAAAAVDAAGSWSLAHLAPGDGLAGSVPRLHSVDASDSGLEVGVAATALRRRRTSKISTRRILELFAGSRDDPAGHADDRAPGGSGTADREAETVPPANSRREFIASMLGRASLTGTTFEARFDTGRFCGLHERSLVSTTDRPAGHYLVTAKGRHGETVASCFSFETEVSRGLRIEAIAADEDALVRAEIRTEYAFVADYDGLVAGQHILTEGGSPDDLLYALATPVLRADRCDVTGLFGDGSTYDRALSFATPELSLRGEAFEIRDGDATRSLLALDPGGHPIPWSITALRDPEPRIVLGGRYRLGGRSNRYVSLLLVPGDLTGELVRAALDGRLPKEIRAEIAGAAASERRVQHRLSRERREA